MQSPACYRERCPVTRVSGMALEAFLVRCSLPVSNEVARLSTPMNIIQLFIYHGYFPGRI